MGARDSASRNPARYAAAIVEVTVTLRSEIEDSRSHPQLHARLRRPFGLKAIIALQLAQFAFGVFVFILFTLTIPDLQADLDQDAAALLRLPVTFYLILGLLRGLTAIGLWRYRRWAWVLTMTLLAASMAMDAAAFFRGRPYYFSMLVNVLLVFYLNQREVQQLFVVSTAERAP